MITTSINKTASFIILTYTPFPLRALIVYCPKLFLYFTGSRTLQLDFHLLLQALIIFLQYFHYFRSGKFCRQLSSLRKGLPDHGPGNK